MNLWVTSDTHFSHANTFLKFKKTCSACDHGMRPGPHDVWSGTDALAIVCETCGGTGQIPLRPFTSIEEMDETIIERWNAVVKPSDHVYHLGDVAMKQTTLALVARLNGHKRLVRGNHDIFKTRKYLDAGFDEIYGVRVLDNAIMSHVPIHPDSFARFRGNVHGHLHANVLPLPYLNVCVEHTDYRPLAWEDIKAKLPQRVIDPHDENELKEVTL